MKDFEPAKRAAASNPCAAARFTGYIVVVMGSWGCARKPRSTPGYTLTPASRARKKPRSTPGYTPASRVAKPRATPGYRLAPASRTRKASLHPRLYVRFAGDMAHIF